MHEEIIRYSMSGDITDSNLENRKSQLVNFLETQMRDEGVVPSLDLDPGFTLDYDTARAVFRFELSVYGVYVGKEGDLWGTAGVTGGKRIMKHTPLSKLKGF